MATFRQRVGTRIFDTGCYARRYVRNGVRMRPVLTAPDAFLAAIAVRRTDPNVIFSPIFAQKCGDSVQSGIKRRVSMERRTPSCSEMPALQRCRSLYRLGRVAQCCN